MKQARIVKIEDRRPAVAPKFYSFLDIESVVEEVFGRYYVMPAVEDKNRNLVRIVPLRAA